LGTNEVPKDIYLGIDAAMLICSKVLELSWRQGFSILFCASNLETLTSL